VEARLDCDGDAVLLIVDQQGPACHTGRPTCFYNAIDGDHVHIITEPAA
jgi:phosphoribosyl-AMP cyclohydrolase